MSPIERCCKLASRHTRRSHPLSWQVKKGSGQRHVVFEQKTRSHGQSDGKTGRTIGLWASSTLRATLRKMAADNGNGPG